MLGFTSVELGFTSVELGFASVELGFTSVRIGFTSVELVFTSVRIGFTSVRIGFTSVEENIASGKWKVFVKYELAASNHFKSLHKPRKIIGNLFYLYFKIKLCQYRLRALHNANKSINKIENV